MLKKSLLAFLTLFLMMFAAGCGGGDDTKKAGTDQPQYSADKAVMAYAEMYAFGVSDHLAEAGLTEADTKEVSDKIVGDLVSSFAQFPLSDESVAEMVGVYVGKLNAAMELKATIKKDDPENPVVELSAQTINNKAAEEMAANNEDLMALGVALGQLQSEGYSLEDLKSSAEFQKSAMECIDNFINEIPLNPVQSIEVPCEKVEGSDGKIYWGPKDPVAVRTFVQGK